MQTLKSNIEDKKPAEKRKPLLHNFSAYSNITEQYASESAFLWLLRSQAVTSSLYTTVDIIEFEERIEANLRGLSSTGEHGWQACVEQLQYEEAGEVFTAAVVALRSRNATQIKMVCELALRTAEMTKGLVSALAWVESEIAEFWIQRFLSVTDPVYKELGLAVCGARRDYPEKYLLAILKEPTTVQNPALHSRALRLIGELKRWELVPALNAAMDADDPQVRFWANWSAALMGNLAAINNLKPWILEDSVLSNKAVQLVFSTLPIVESRSWVAAMVQKPELNRLTIKAIGVLGDPQAIPWLIQIMDKPNYARIAGWAFCQITGIDLEKTNLTVEPPEGDNQGPTDDAEDDNVAMDVDEDLLWPDKNKVARLWQVHNRLLQPGQRYFQGQEVTKQLLDNIYVNANQHQKELAALQRAIHDKHTAFVNTKARII